MTLRLVLMRHAKSAWDQPGVRDHDRQLNERGRLAAQLMGAFLREATLGPDFAYVSSAARTQETWERMGLQIRSETLPSLYHANAGDILRIVQGAPSDTKTLLILGHQPTMQEAANRLLRRWEIDEYPTAKLAVISFDASSWAEITLGAGTLLREASPKSLV